MRVLIRGRVRWAALIAIVGALAVGGAAYAVIPDSTGVIHTCYMKSGGALRVIDNLVTKCKASETALPISQTGPPGAPGQDGQPGAPGVSGYEIVTNEDSSPTDTLVLGGFTAECPAGKTVLGGGANHTLFDGGSTPGRSVINSWPSSDTVWSATFSGSAPFSGGYVATVYAICANVS